MLKFLESQAEWALISGRKEKNISKTPETNYNTPLRETCTNPFARIVNEDMLKDLVEKY
jgi:hypothetical protein